MFCRYNNRPALVVSALQVEKNPLCQPGPCTPIGVRSNFPIQKWRIPTHAIHAAITLSPPRSIIRKRTTPSSPKMKLRFFQCSSTINFQNLEMLAFKQTTFVQLHPATKPD